jgi:hypothetical protein
MNALDWAMANLPVDIKTIGIMVMQVTTVVTGLKVLKLQQKQTE